MMNIRKNKSQELAAAKAGISERSARMRAWLGYIEEVPTPAVRYGLDQVLDSREHRELPRQLRGASRDVEEILRHPARFIDPRRVVVLRRRRGHVGA